MFQRSTRSRLIAIDGLVNTGLVAHKYNEVRKTELQKTGKSRGGDLNERNETEKANRKEYSSMKCYHRVSDNDIKLLFLPMTVAFHENSRANGEFSTRLEFKLCSLPSCIRFEHAGLFGQVRNNL